MPRTEAVAAINRALQRNVDDLFVEFGEPMAAASIAQVHRATVRDADGELRTVAVKVLRPGVEARFRRDLDSFFLAARIIEWLMPAVRRLRPVAAVETLARSVRLEMDLRLEAAALSEMGENTREDPGFRVPKVDWVRTAKGVMTLEWIDGLKLTNPDRLIEAGHDPVALSKVVMQSFLRHAMRDGFFHADMHQGNLFVDTEGTLVAVDFGIMGRLNKAERRFLAEILYGFIRRDYLRTAQVHFEAGYVPPEEEVEVFAQALRAIGEPLRDRPAREISMAHLLSQLFEYTEVFHMTAQPRLILLQKTMVVVEGVARSLDPDLDIWTTSEPWCASGSSAISGRAPCWKRSATVSPRSGNSVSPCRNSLPMSSACRTVSQRWPIGALRLNARRSSVSATSRRASSVGSQSRPGSRHCHLRRLRFMRCGERQRCHQLSWRHQASNTLCHPGLRAGSNGFSKS